LLPHLVVGGDSFIGSALAQRLNAVATTRRKNRPDRPFFDLLHPDFLPQAEVTYFCAGICGFMACETNPKAWDANVVGNVKAAAWQVKNRGKVVLLSSAAVETQPETAYGGYKLATEIGFRQFKHAASIFRFGPVVLQGSNRFKDGDYHPIELDDLVERLAQPFQHGVHRILGRGSSLMLPAA
jgi:nucleoside-diphosphate-sugar epimerase